MRRVVWQEEQAEKIRLQQQRQKLKEDTLQRRDGGCWEHEIVAGPGHQISASFIVGKP